MWFGSSEITHARIDQTSVSVQVIVVASGAGWRRVWLNARQELGARGGHDISEPLSRGRNRSKPVLNADENMTSGCSRSCAAHGNHLNGMLTRLAAPPGHREVSFSRLRQLL